MCHTRGFGVFDHFGVLVVVHGWPKIHLVTKVPFFGSYGNPVIFHLNPPVVVHV